MKSRIPFERILRSLHEAVFDDALWSTACGLIHQYCGTRGSFLSVGDGATRGDTDIFFKQVCAGAERHTGLERLYFETYYATDERIPRLRRLPDGKVRHVSSLFTEAEMKTSATYNEFLPGAHARDGLNVRLDGPRGSRIVWALADPMDADAWSSARITTVRNLQPHLRQYVRVRQALVDARAFGASALGLLENNRLGVIQLDRRGRVVAANHGAQVLLHGGDGLRDEDCCLRATTPAQDASLQHLLAQALPFYGGTGAGGSMLVNRRQPMPQLAVHVHPVGKYGGVARGSQLGALVLVDDLATSRRIDPAQLAASLGLTPAESRIAALLAQGRSIDAVAAATGRNRTTIKWHMRHIYSKHGLSRQVELVQLVKSLSEVARPPG